MSYGFRPMTAADLAMVRDWALTPDAAAWWDDPDEFGVILGESDTRAWIVSLDGRPFAYLQDYDPHAWPGHHFAFLPPGARGVDQFIGVPEMIGVGHGSAFVRQHVDRLFAEAVPAVGTDPHPDNPRAIRAYEKAGFVRGDTRETGWGLSLLMTRYPQ